MRAFIGAIAVAMLPTSMAVGGGGQAQAALGRGRLMRTETAEATGAHDLDEEGELEGELLDAIAASKADSLLDVAGPGPAVQGQNLTNPPKKFGPFTMLGARDLISFCKDNKEGIRCDSQNKGRTRDRFYVIQDLGAGWGGWSALQGGRKNSYCRVKLYNEQKKDMGGRIICDVTKLTDLDDLGKFRLDYIDFDKPDGLGIKRKWQSLRNKGSGGYCTNNIDRIDCGPKIAGSVQNDYFSTMLYKAHTTTTTSTTTATFSFNIVMPQDPNKTEAAQEKAEEKAAEDSEAAQARREEQERLRRLEEAKKQKRKTVMKETSDSVASGEPDKPVSAPSGAPPGAAGFR